MDGFEGDSSSWGRKAPASEREEVSSEREAVRSQMRWPRVNASRGVTRCFPSLSLLLNRLPVAAAAAMSVAAAAPRHRPSLIRLGPILFSLLSTLVRAYPTSSSSNTLTLAIAATKHGREDDRLTKGEYVEKLVISAGLVLLGGVFAGSVPVLLLPFQQQIFLSLFGEREGALSRPPEGWGGGGRLPAWLGSGRESKQETQSRFASDRPTDGVNGCLPAGTVPPPRGSPSLPSLRPTNERTNER